jgi:flagellum-specific peptidoglycan hydrolase FlgJ
MATVKTKKEFDAMSTPNLILYLDSLPKATFDGYVDPNVKVRYFIGKYGTIFEKYVKDTNLFYNGVIAQSIFESGYGRSNQAFNANNFAGVKYNKNIHSDFWTGANGVKWAKWESADAGIKGHIDVILASRYKTARDTTNSPEQQIKGFITAGYDPLSTPTHYLSQMQGILNRVRKLLPFGRIKK